jgi:hypothetical protein
MIILLLVIAGLLIPDLASDGWLRAEVGGGVKGAAKDLWRTETARARKARQARRARNTQTRWGRVRNAVGEESLVMVASIARGWRAGRKAAQIRRRARRDLDAARAAAGLAADEQVPCPDCGGSREVGCDWCAGDGTVPAWTVDPALGVIPWPDWAQTEPPGSAPEPAPIVHACLGCAYGVENHGKPHTCGKTNEPPASETPPAEQINRKGPATMTDITTAPEAIEFWRSLYAKLEPIVDESATVSKSAEQGADGMGDFAVGNEDDAAGQVKAFGVAGNHALEAIASVIEALVREFGASIEAADGKSTAAHAPFQAA